MYVSHVTGPNKFVICSHTCSDGEKIGEKVARVMKSKLFPCTRWKVNRMETALCI